MKISAYDKNSEQWLEKKKLGHDYLEKPAMYSKLPGLKGKKVLCLGCGAGEECEYIKSLGAKKVIGIDISKKLIKIAKKNHPSIEFKIMDIEKLNFPENSFDFIYSSLALHYIERWRDMLKRIKKILKKDATFLFSTHNPAYWNHGDYLKPRKINDIWFENFKVSYYHKPFSSMINDIIGSGFEIIDCLEPKPLKSAKNIDKKFWEKSNKTPLFIIFELKKKWEK